MILREAFFDRSQPVGIRRRSGPGRTAQANRASRWAASKVTSGIMFGGSTGIKVTGTAVTGRVLSFDMTARQPHDFPELVDYNGPGVDVCP
jgi:hypothetical protein